MVHCCEHVVQQVPVALSKATASPSTAKRALQRVIKPGYDVVQDRQFACVEER